MKKSRHVCKELKYERIYRKGGKKVTKISTLEAIIKICNDIIRWFMLELNVSIVSSFQKV